MGCLIYNISATISDAGLKGKLICNPFARAAYLFRTPMAPSVDMNARFSRPAS